MLTETFRFEDKNDYEYEIWFKVFSRIVKKDTPEFPEIDAASRAHTTFYLENLVLVVVLVLESKGL